jgi:hypothetical protein
MFLAFTTREERLKLGVKENMLIVTVLTVAVLAARMVVFHLILLESESKSNRVRPRTGAPLRINE